MTDEEKPKLAPVLKLKNERPQMRMLMARDFYGMTKDSSRNLVILISRLTGKSIHEVEVMPAGEYLWWQEEINRQVQPPKEWK